ncbi:MAG: DUF3598 domain-containing protein [Gammaproteobacteria bacterium]
METSDMTDLAELMPLLAGQAGVWEGTYRYYDADGRLVDEHASRLTCRVAPGDGYDYHQTNLYTWADGRTDTREFRGRWRDDRLWFDDGPIEGWVAEDRLDPDRRTLLLQWRRRDEPGTRFYEMIQLDAALRLRSRVWQWIGADGRTRLRTLIDEHKVADDRR